jgi:hypothetical protein
VTTKSASNRYFKTRYSKKGNKKARVNYSWAKDFNKRILKKTF